MRASASASRNNPDALPGVPEPLIGMHAVNDTFLYAEVRGSGPPVLLMSAGVEDAEVFRRIAERLGGCTVVTHDRRGGRRSGREGWPTGGSAVHADDAADLLRTLGLQDVVVFGASAGGVVATQLALRHPAIVRRALIYEPGYFSNVPGGRDIERRGSGALTEHLAAHPGDWAGALAALGRAAAPSGEASPRGFFGAPPGKDWYAARSTRTPRCSSATTSPRPGDPERTPARRLPCRVPFLVRDRVGPDLPAGGLPRHRRWPRL